MIVAPGSLPASLLYDPNAPHLTLFWWILDHLARASAFAVVLRVAIWRLDARRRARSRRRHPLEQPRGL